jgi:hypothetical protein
MGKYLNLVESIFIGSFGDLEDEMELLVQHPNLDRQTQ